MSLLASIPGAVQAQTGIISGSVRTELPAPVVNALVTLGEGRDVKNVRTDASGAFRFSDVRRGTVRLHVAMPGFAPWERLVTVDSAVTVVEIILQRAAQRLDSVVVTASRSGLYGFIGDLKDLSPLRGAIVSVIGARAVDTTDEGGRYDLPKVPAGRAFVVRIVRDGYEPRTVSIDVPPRRGYELIAFLDPAERAVLQSESLWREFDNRATYGGASAALVPRAALGDNRRASLLSGLIRARPVLAKSLFIHANALADANDPSYPCIFIDGRLADRLTVLDQFTVADVDAVEVYGYNTQQDRRLKDWIGPSRRPPCGAVPTHAVPLGAGSMNSPLVPETTRRSTITTIVIWLRR